jgi:hypothetical protein
MNWAYGGLKTYPKDALGDVADAGSTHAKTATEGFFARGPRLESVTLGPSNPWLLDPSAPQQVAKLAQVEASTSGCVSASMSRCR